MNSLERRQKKIVRRRLKRTFCKSIKREMHQYERLNLLADNKHERYLCDYLLTHHKSEIRRQYRVGFFFIDILVVDRLLAIEVDGDSHKVLSRAVKDRKKDELIRSFGLAVVHIDNDDVYNADLIETVLAKYPSHPKHADIFKGIHHRVVGHIGYLVAKMSKRIVGKSSGARH